MLLKKLSYVCAVTLVIVSLAGCGTKENSTGTDTASTQTQEDVCSVVKRVDTFLNTIFRKDRITPAFPCRTPLFHLVYNH